MKKQKYLVVIGGPTASGKTGVAIQIADYFKTEIISADSRQCYKEMTVGTAKPTATELATVPHHFVDCCSVHENFTVGHFERKALELLDQGYQDRDIFVLTGGSGLYIRALCEGLDEFPEVSPEIRKNLIDQYQKEGITFLQKTLAELDPVYFKMVDTNNPQRMIRALEVCIASGLPYSDFRKKTTAERPFQTINIQLDWDRADLYERINLRVDLMIKNGLIAEAESLYPFKHLNALQTVGYQELFDYFDQKTSKEEAIELIKRNSRRYAKRQLTWMRKDGFWKNFKPQDIHGMLAYIKSIIHSESPEN